MANEHGLLAQWNLVKNASTDHRLSRSDIAVLIVILDAINQELGVAWPGLKRIASVASADRSTVVRSVSKLSTLGYVLRESGDRTRSNRYRIGRCQPAPGRELAPSLASALVARCRPAPGVGASQRIEVGANSRPELAHKNLPNEPTQLNPLRCDRFAEFWTAYPRKACKAKAVQVWKCNKLDAIADEVLADVRARVADPGHWTDPTYIPHPTTYLHQRRWEDEWKAATSQAVKPSVADDFQGKKYLGTAAEDLPEYLRGELSGLPELGGSRDV